MDVFVVTRVRHEATMFAIDPIVKTFVVRREVCSQRNICAPVFFRQLVDVVSAAENRYRLSLRMIHHETPGTHQDESVCRETLPINKHEPVLLKVTRFGQTFSVNTLRKRLDVLAGLQSNRLAKLIERQLQRSC